MFQKGSHIVVYLLALNLLASYAMKVEAKTTTVVHAGTLLAIPGEPPQLEQTIVIRDNLITQVLDGFVDPSSLDANAEFLDLSDKFVLPGLMDMHVHLLIEIGPNSRTDRPGAGTEADRINRDG